MHGIPPTRPVTAALDVWLAARTAAGAAPSPARIARVREKLEDRSSHLVVATLAERAVGVARVEQFRTHQGLGAAVPGGPTWTRSSNVRAQALYRRRGFARTGQRGDTPSGAPTERWERR